MVSVIVVRSFRWWSLWRVGSQGQRVAHHAVAGKSSAERADEVERVHLDVFAAVALAERAAGSAGQVQVERLAVELCPLPDDVGDEASVVDGVDVHAPTGGGMDVDAVRPGVASEADFEE